MNWSKIFALSLRHIYLIKGSFPRILDLIYWPTIQIFLWGFISKFFTLSSSYYNNTVGIILSAAILYDFLFRSSISYNMMFLEEIWSRNFTNLFIAPIKLSEKRVSEKAKEGNISNHQYSSIETAPSLMSNPHELKGG